MLSAYHTSKSMILSAPFGVVTLTGVAMKKTIIGDTDDRRLKNLVNSASAAPPIGLFPKGVEFCHTLNILLVGHRCSRALSRLQFNPCVVCLRFTVHNKGCRALGGFPPKGLM